MLISYCWCFIVIYVNCVKCQNGQDSTPATVYEPYFPQGDRRSPSVILQPAIQPTYFVVAPLVVRPSTVYRVVVTLLKVPYGDDNGRKIDIRASMARDGTEIASAGSSMIPGNTAALLLKVPPTSIPGHYRLRVEGNHPRLVGGTVFLNVTDLIFSSRFLTIVIQTSRYVYNGGQTVRFRAVMLNTELLPYDDSVNVYIMDPNGFIMRRWPSVDTTYGVVSLDYPLPEIAKVGYWKIRVEARAQIEEKTIKVETFYQPQFETLISMPYYFSQSDESVDFTVAAYYATERSVRGNATIRLYAKYLGIKNSVYQLLWIHTIGLMYESHDASYPMWKIQAKMGQLSGVQIRIEADVMEYYLEETRMGFAEGRIINSSLHLHFVGSSPMIFKPGMTFESHIAISYHDKEPLSPERLEKSRLRIEVSATMENGGHVSLPQIIIPRKDVPVELEDWEYNDNNDPNLLLDHYYYQKLYEKYRSEGIFRIKLDTPKRSTILNLRAYYEDDEGSTAEAQLTALAYYSPQTRYLSVTTSSSGSKVGEYVVIHVKSNFAMDSFQYVIMSKDLLLHSNEYSVEVPWPTITTFSVPVSAEMAPSFRVIAYQVTMDGEVISDSVFIPVDGINRQKVGLSLNQAKDHTKDSVEARFSANPGAYYAVSIQRSIRHFMQAGNEISETRVMEALHGFENFSRSVHKVLWRSRDGSFADRSEYFTSMNYGLDSNRTFAFAGLVALTDAFVPLFPRFDSCNASRGSFPCLISGCYSDYQICNGNKDCTDGIDETDCPPPDDDYITFRESRIARFADFYDVPDGDWAWLDLSIGHRTKEWYNLVVPKITDDWYLNAFSISKDKGFGIISAPIKYESFRPFMMVVDAPQSVRRGEQLGIRTILFNRQEREILVLMTLHDSPDYMFVHVENDGIISNYNPRLSRGDHQHLVWIAANSQIEVRLPISPQIDQGVIEVAITAVTQIGRDYEIIEINVQAEGATIAKHTSVFLDLKNRATVLRFMDIYVEESPIVPYSYWRRYVYGSPSAKISLCGDVVGPAFPSIPVNMEALLGRVGRGTEARAFDLAANMWTLHYLRLTNQLDWSVAKTVFPHANSIFAQIMKRYSPQGWFKLWNIGNPSVWLTSWVLHIFKHASFQDWENYFYIEPQIFTRSLKWLLRYQTQSGSFVETYWYRNPLNKRMRSWSSRGDAIIGNRNISLTAQMVITLQETTNMVDGSLRGKAYNAKLKAIRYLEQQLPHLQDPHEVAITAYALWLCDSGEKELAYSILHKIRREDDGLIYWSPGEVPGKSIRLENQRPFIQPKDNQFYDAISVEITSYALMVYLMRDGVTAFPEKIVYWLNSMRIVEGGFISTLDTVVAMQALTEYSFRARLRDITDMKVTIDVPSTPGFVKTLQIGNTSMATLQSLDIPNVWGHVNVIAQGAGQAIIQLDVTFGIDWEPLKDTPPEDCFELNIREYYSEARNKTAITIQSCFRWTLESESPVSDTAVLEIEIPTGYGLLQTDAVALVASGIHPTLKDARIIPGKSIFFFDYIPAYTTCFNHTINRWHPVANMTEYRGALLYESYAPERFVMEVFNSTPLYLLNICEVCGSYQCPYCPFYSDARNPSANLPFVIVSVSFIFIFILQY